MNFASDNTAGVSPRILEALKAANEGFAPSYGGDALTRQVEQRLSQVFERPVTVLLVATGTAANALCLAAIAPPWTAVLCSHHAHVMTDECGAVEMFTAGARLVGMDGKYAKLDAAVLAERLESWPGGRPHVLQPAALTVSQASEFGTVWTPYELGSVGALAKRHGLRLHVDGARFANAVAALGCAPADISWRAGVDIMSFGATKNGAMGAEAILVFDPEIAVTLEKRRMRAGQLLSKSRFVAAQLLAYLEDGHWLDLASHANRMAAHLAKAVEAAPRARLAVPVEANEVFAWIAGNDVERLRAAGAAFYEWPGAAASKDFESAGADERLVRLVTSFATTENDVEQFAAVLKS